MTAEAKTLFFDGQRVRKLDLESLQDNLLKSLSRLQTGFSNSGICWGFRVSGVDDSTISISSGLAYDAFARPIINIESIDFPIVASDDSTYIFLKYLTKIADEVNGQPRIVEHDRQIISYASFTEANDDEIPLVQIRPRENGYDIIQKGDWYIPPVTAKHSGQFFEDAAGRWRYDGDALGTDLTPDFDSGWLDIVANSDLNIEHGLGSNELLAQLQRQVSESVFSSQGNGSDYYYELHDNAIVRIVNSNDLDLKLRVKLWKLDESEFEAVNPVADAGMDLNTEYGDSFMLDGSDSIAFSGRSVVRFKWTLIN